MPIANDWTIDTKAKTIAHSSGTTVYTVNALYSYLADVFDNIEYSVHGVPMFASTPDIYGWRNGWKMADETSYQFLKSGALTDVEHGDTYVNIQTIGTITAGSNIFIYRTDGTIIPSWWLDGHVDILVKVKEAGSLISSGSMRVFIREYGNEYDFFELDASSKLVNTVALSTANDFSNNTLEATVATYTDITLTFGAIYRDLDNGVGLVKYDMEIDCNFRPLQEVFEYTKYLTRRGNLNAINGVTGEQYISIDVAYPPNKKSPFGTFVGGKWYVARGIWLKNYLIQDEENFELVDALGNIQIPPLNLGFQLTGLFENSVVAIFDTVNDSLLTKFEGSTTTVQYRYTYSENIPVRVVIAHNNYKNQEFNTVLGNFDASIPVNQLYDPTYSNV